MQYKAIFIDIDDTLLDYVPCCRDAFEAAMLPFRDSSPASNDQLFALFFSVSGRLFSEAKHGMHTIAEVMELYPAEFMERSGLLRNCADQQEKQAQTDIFKHAFRAAWGETHTLVPHAIEILEALRDRGYRLFAASNSFGHLQRRRMERAGILHYFETTFISMDIGFDKPDIRFFQHAEQAISTPQTSVSPQQILMIGDSMSTDIIGAKAAGWDTCFFNRRPEEQQSKERADYEIRSLTELLTIL